MTGGEPSRVEAVLDRVHQALRKADYAALAALADRLEEECAALGEAGANLVALRAKAARNAACLDAAARGLRAARRRVEEVRSQGRAMQTYDAQGQRQALGGSGLGPDAGLARRF